MFFDWKIHLEKVQLTRGLQTRFTRREIQLEIPQDKGITRL